MELEKAVNSTGPTEDSGRYRGYYDRTIYFNPANKYCVLVIRSNDPNIPQKARSGRKVIDNMFRFTVTGYNLPRAEGVEISWEGDWKTGKYGCQLQTTQWKEIIPKTIEGIQGYLSSGLIKGIGPKTAAAIVSRFGMDTLEVFDKEPERLLEIRGITESRLQDIKQSYLESHAIRDLMTLLSPFRVSPKTATAIYRFFGSNSVKILRDNPYQLCRAPGFGFLRVDAIVQKNGGKLDDPGRIRAALLFTLTDNKSKCGHLYLEKEYLLEEAFQLLNKNVLLPELHIGRSKVNEQFLQMLLEKEIMSTKDCIYLPTAFFLEDETAGKVADMLQEQPPLEEVNSALKAVKDNLGIALSPQQEAAVKTACRYNLSIITGGPGTGKTTVLKAILDVHQRLYPRSTIMLMAPTGRASRRMAESTGFVGARTLHSALHLRTEEEDLPEGNKKFLDADLIIVDETSMVDQWLAKQLFSRIRPGTKVVLVGDADQLPSVGAGNVFRELIDCGIIPVTVLDRIFRQSEGSRIAYNARYINQARTDLLYGDDFTFYRCESQQAAAERICSHYLELGKEYGIEHVMILSPFRSEGNASAERLNEVIREEVNPYHAELGELRYGNQTFRPGDRVMQMKNNYDMKLYDQDDMLLGSGVFNGDVGTIRSIGYQGESARIVVDYDGRLAAYSQENLDELAFAYATTVHKAMGSEYRVVLMPVLRAHTILLNRNLIYTAITRAKEQVILVGQKDALLAAILRQKADRRNTMLGERICRYSRAQAIKSRFDSIGEWKEVV